MAIHTREEWQTALDVRHQEFWEGYEEPETMLKNLFRMVPHNGRDRMTMDQAGTFQDYQEFTGQVTYSQRYPMYKLEMVYVPFTNGYTIEKMLKTDEQYELFDGEPEELKKSAYRTRDKDAARILTEAFSVNTDFYTFDEGVAMCSDSHTTRASGVSTATGFDNLTTAAFSSTALKAARIQHRQLRGDQGERLDIEPDTLVYPTDLYERVHEVVKSPQKDFTATNASNVHYEKFNMWEWIRLDDDASNWFLGSKAMMQKNQVWVDRDPLDFESINDFDTYQYKTRSWMRYAFGHRDWRHIIGANVA